MEPLISVIVPVYKVEQYLHKCVDSILAQTYTNLEVILVDDGSPDGCGDICDEYAKQDNRVVIIHKENGGLSDARNAGLDIARGEHIGFVDSDDWIEQDMYEKLYNALVGNNADISICGVRDMPSGNVRPMLNTTERAMLTVDRIYMYDEINIGVPNRLYRKELFSNIRFPKGKCFEDIVTTYKLLTAASVVSCTEVPLYNYLHRDNSISRTTLNLNAIDCLEQWQELRELIPSSKQDLKSKCDFHLEHQCLVNLKYLFAKEKEGYNNDDRIIYNVVLEKIDKNYFSWMCSKHVPLKHKLVLTVAKYNLFMPFKKLAKQ